MSAANHGATLVAAAAQTALAGYVAVSLTRRARTVERKTIARCVSWLAAYAAMVTIGHALNPPWSLVLYGLCHIPVVIGMLHGLSFARWLMRGEVNAPAMPLIGVRPVAISLAVAIDGHAAISGLFGRDPPFDQFAIAVEILVLVSAILGMFVVAWRRKRDGAAWYLATFLLPVLPVVYVAIEAVLGEPLPGGALVRDVCVLLFISGIFATYLDNAREAMSLTERLTAAALTVFLAFATVAAHLTIPRHGDTSEPALRLLAGELLMVLVVVLVVPRLFKRTLIEPMNRLLGGIERLERGEATLLPIDQDDELGRVTRSFNDVAAALVQQRKDLEHQAEELRHQVAARSREIAELLERSGAESRTLSVGDVVDGRYVVESVLGSGGMGVVFGVRRRTDQRALALKIMSTVTSRADAARFAREAEIGAGLHHPYLVNVVDVGMHEGMAYLVMERVEGGSLEDARARFGDVTWALPLLAQMAQGLAALHARGILHRDLKPANVLLATSKSGQCAKITDFGLARRDDVDVLAATMQLNSANPMAATNAQTQGLLGTLPYLAPELGDGRKATAAADMFAFGLVAYELLTKARPFTMPPIFEAIAGRTLPEPPPLPTSLGPVLSEALRDCLRDLPGRRPTAGHVASLFGAEG